MVKASIIYGQPSLGVIKSEFENLKLILVGRYLSCRIQMYLNRNFHSNPTLSHSMFRYFIVGYLYFFLQRSRNT